MTTNYDFVVIGGGSGGYAAARTASDLGLKTAVIDGADTLGGLCILHGCMPSKTLIESANHFRNMRRAREFGIHTGDELRAIPKEIIARKRRLIDEFASYRQGQLADGRFDLICGTASFLSDSEVAISPLAPDSDVADRIGFRSACVATGSQISRIPVPGLEETGYWTSDDILEAEDLLDSIVVLGGGAIALEMACYLEGLGKQVTVIQRSDQVITGSDRDVAKALEGALEERENMTIFTGTRLLEVKADGQGRKTVSFEQGGEIKTAGGGEILQALGREPRTVGLNLKAAGIELAKDGKHIGCMAEQRTSVPHIFAAGDVCGPHEVVHMAIEQGEIAAHNAAVFLEVSHEETQKIDYRLKLLGIFTDPEVATVGLTEAEAEKEGRKVVAASHPFADHGKSMVKGELHGFVKLIADAGTGELVGGAVVGPEAVDLIHEIVVAMYFQSTVSDFIKIPHYHPTLSEIWTYPAEELLFL